MTKIDTTELESFVKAYIEAMFFTDIDNHIDSRDKEGFEEKGIEDIAPVTYEKIIQDCKAFFTAHYELIEDHLEQAGHDFWLTRNGHGVGFWDRPEIYGEEGAETLSDACGLRTKFPAINAYISDDGKIYLE